MNAITIETLVLGCSYCEEQRFGIDVDGRRPLFCYLCGNRLTAGHICSSCGKFRDDPDGWDEVEGKCPECVEAGR